MDKAELVALRALRALGALGALDFASPNTVPCRGSAYTSQFFSCFL